MIVVTTITCFNCHTEIDGTQLIEVSSKSAARSRARKTAVRFPWNMPRVPNMLRLDDYQIVTRCVCGGDCYRSSGGSDDSSELVEGIDFPYASDLV